MLRQAEKQLQAGCEPFASEMLFTVLEGANYICQDLVKSKQGGDFALRAPVLEALRWLTVALDPLLRLSGGIVKAPRVESFKAVSKRLILIIDAIDKVQFWRRAQEVHRVEPMEFVIADGDRLLDPEQPEFYAALSEVMAKLGPDLTWRKYFTEQILLPRLCEEQPLYEQAFRQYYRLEASDFATLKAYFQNVAQNHSEKVASLQIPPLDSNRLDISVSQGFREAINIVFGILQGMMPVEEPPRFTPLAFREHVLADLQSQMHDEKDKAEKWLEALEYHPGIDILRHPLIPLTEGNRQVYALFPWALYPAQICGEQWDGELFLLQKPRSEWAETIGEWYGNGFRDYVVKMLQETGVVDLSREQEISVAEFGDELSTWLNQLPQLPNKRKGGFSIDIVFQKEEATLLVSCKAPDLYFDYWLLRNYLFMPAKVIRDAIKTDIAHLKEISIEGECIASMEAIRQRLGIQVKRILPILVTSRKEPLGSPILRTYLAQREAIPTVPSVTVDELREFIISGFDASVLPLPFPPRVLHIG